MHGFSRADAEEYSQDFHAAGPLCHRRVKAIATLFDGRHMERGSVGDGLEVVSWGKVGVGSGDCCKHPRSQAWNGLWKHETRIQIGVIRGAAIPSPPTSIQGELHEICEPRFPAGACRRAARQSTKLLEVGWCCTLGHQICVQESEMSNLIVGVVMDVLIKVPVEVLSAAV